MIIPALWPLHGVQLCTGTSQWTFHALSYVYNYLPELYILTVIHMQPLDYNMQSLLPMCISHPGGGLEEGIYTCRLCTHISYALIEEQTLDVIL